MKIAIPTADNRLCMHFGHCEKFVIVTVDESTKTIIGKEEAVPPPHEPGVLPKWLHEKEVNLIIAEEWACALNSIFSNMEFRLLSGHHRKILRQLLSVGSKASW